MLELMAGLERIGTGPIGGADKPQKMAGDIIVVRRAPYKKWGRMERQLYLITYFDDEEAEAMVTAQQVTILEGDVACISCPFPVYEERDRGDGTMIPVLVNRSKFRVNVNVTDPACLFIGSPGLDPYDDTSEPVSPNKTGDDKYCPECDAKVVSASDACETCGGSLTRYLVRADLIEDASARI